MNPTLHVRIVSPQQLILDTQASSISSRNSAGNFDILPQHADFVSLVENNPITIRLDGQKDLVYKFPLAIIYTMNNQVNIYTYILSSKQLNPKP